MNEIIKQHLIAVAEKNNWPTDKDTLIEILTEANEVYTKKVSDHRWWYIEFIVADVDGMLIGYEYAKANRDEHVRDLGWEFDLSTICQVEAVQETVTVYKKVNPAGGQSGVNNMNIEPKDQEEVKEQPADAVAPAEQATEESAEEGTTEG